METVMVGHHGLYCSESRTDHYRKLHHLTGGSVSDLKEVIKLIPVEKKFILVKKKTPKQMGTRKIRKMAEL